MSSENREIRRLLLIVNSLSAFVHANVLVGEASCPARQICSQFERKSWVDYSQFGWPDAIGDFGGMFVP